MPEPFFFIVFQLFFSQFHYLSFYKKRNKLDPQDYHILQLQQGFRPRKWNGMSKGSLSKTSRVLIDKNQSIRQEILHFCRHIIL